MAHHGAPTATGVAPIRNATQARPDDPGERPRRQGFSDRGLAHADTLAGDNAPRRTAGSGLQRREEWAVSETPAKKTTAKKTPAKKAPAKKASRQEDGGEEGSRQEGRRQEGTGQEDRARRRRRPRQEGRGHADDGQADDAHPAPLRPRPSRWPPSARKSPAERAVDVGAPGRQHRGADPEGRPGDRRARGRGDRRPREPAVRGGDLRAHQDAGQEHQAGAQERACRRRRRPVGLARSRAGRRSEV